MLFGKVCSLQLGASSLNLQLGTYLSAKDHDAGPAASFIDFFHQVVL